MRRMMFCLALLFAMGPAAAIADEPPIHDCLEGGSMDMTTVEAPPPQPSAGS